VILKVTNRAARLLIFVLLALCSLFIHLKLQHYPFDDAYIHIRIADHLATYGQPYYNLGEPVLATSAPNWTMLLGLVFKFAGASSVVVAVLNSLFVVTGAWVFTRLMARLLGNRSTALALIIFGALYLSLIAESSLGLMETPLALLLLGLTLEGFLKQKSYCYLLAGLLIGFRLELGVFLALLLFFGVVTYHFNLKATARMLILVGIGLLPMLSFELGYFGTLIPNTIRAKSIVYQIPQEQVVGMAWTSLDPVFMGLNIPLGGKGMVVLICLATVVEFVGVMRKARRQKARQAPLTPPHENTKNVAEILLSQRIKAAMLVGGILILLAYCLGRALIFDWYVPLYMVPLVFFIYCAIVRQWKVWGIGLITIVMLTYLGVLSNYAAAAVTDPGMVPNFAINARTRKYVTLGQQLAELFPNQSLLTSEIGGLGYGFKGYIADGAGLVTPAALKYHPMAVPAERSAGDLGAIPVGYIEETRPPLIVSYDGFVEAFLRSDYAKTYDRIVEPILLPDDLRRGDQLWGNRYLNIFVRKELLTPVARFGNSATQLELLLPHLERTTLRSSEMLTLHLFLHPLMPSKSDIKLRVSLINANGVEVLNEDQLPQLAPTSSWDESLIYFEHFSFAVDVPSGTYTVAVGLVDSVTGTPLSTNNQTAFVVGTISVS